MSFFSIYFKQIYSANVPRIPVDTMKVDVNNKCKVICQITFQLFLKWSCPVIVPDFWQNLKVFLVMFWCYLSKILCIRVIYFKFQAFPSNISQVMAVFNLSDVFRKKLRYNIFSFKLFLVKFWWYPSKIPWITIIYFKFEVFPSTFYKVRATFSFQKICRSKSDDFIFSYLKLNLVMFWWYLSKISWLRIIYLKFQAFPPIISKVMAVFIF